MADGPDDDLTLPLIDALVDAYGNDEEGLAQMVSAGLHLSLPVITTADGVGNKVFRLVQKIEGYDKTQEELLRAAYEHRPGRPKLRRLYLHHFGGHAPAQGGGIVASLPDPFAANLLGDVVFLDRKELRQELRAIDAGGSRPVVVVSGAPGSGRRFTHELIRHVARQRKQPLIHVDLDERREAAQNPNDLVWMILLRMKLVKSTDARPAYVRVDDLLDWMLGLLADADKTWWIVLQGFAGGVVSEEVRDLLMGLVTEAGKSLQNVRLALLGYDTAVLPPLLARVRVETPPRIERAALVELLHGAFLDRALPPPPAAIEKAGDAIWEKLPAEDPDRLLLLNRLVCDALALLFPPGVSPADPAWTADLVEARLRPLALRPRMPPPPAGVPVHQAYREAAAVLAWFEPVALRPAGGLAPLGAPLPAFLADCTRGSNERWSLQPEIRRATLADLVRRSAVDAALAANPARPDEPLQRLLEAYLRGGAPPVEAQSLPELLASLQIGEWLAGVVGGLPDRTSVERRIELEGLLRPLRVLAGESFHGRVEELGRLRDHVDLVPLSPPPPGADPAPAPLVIYAAGGMGKSALLARFLLDRADVDAPDRLPFAYLDFDRPSLRVEEPLTLLVEMFRQIAIQYPEVRPSCEMARAQISLSVTAPEGSGTTSSAWDRTRSIAALSIVLHEAGLVERRFILALDTFEEVQNASRGYIAELRSFLRELQLALPGIRVIVSGRLPIEGLEGNALPLRELDAPAAEAFLASRGVADPATARAVVERFGGNPLNLWLAAEVVKRERLCAGQIDDVVTRATLYSGIRDALVQGQLYDRLLGHIHGRDEDLRKVARLALVLRVLTEDVLARVLAGPAGVAPLDGGRAHQLFEALGREALGTLEGGVLRHRADVRRLALDLLRAASAAEVTRIHRGAVAYYAARPPGSVEDRAEEIYHRLCLDDDLAVVEARWLDGVEPHLRGAVGEIPVRQRAYLASRLGLDLDEGTRREADLADWERDAEKRVREKLRIGRVEEIEEALVILGERRERTDRSPLLFLQAQALERLERWDEASRLIAAALAAVPPGTDDEARLSLLRLQGDIAERRCDYPAALPPLEEAAALAARLGGSERFIEIGVRRLAVMLRGDRPDVEVRVLRSELATELRKVPDQVIRDNKALYTELASWTGNDVPAVTERIARLLAGEKAPPSHPLSRPSPLSAVPASKGFLGKLSGAQFQELHRALLSAFPSRDHLARMVRFGLDENLESITAGGSLSNAIFELITWAEAQGRMHELLAAARRENPGNPALRAFAETVSGQAPVAAYPDVKSGAPRRLTAEEITGVFEAAIAVGLGGSRSALLGGIEARFVAGLSDAVSPAAQLLSDLHVLNGVRQLVDGSDPLASWLTNAAALASIRREGGVFRDALETVTGRKQG